MANPLNPLAKPDPITPSLSLRSPEAAKAIGVCEKTLWNLRKAGKIPHVRPSKGVVLYPVSALEKWLAEQATTTVTETTSTPPSNADDAETGGTRYKGKAPKAQRSCV